MDCLISLKLSKCFDNNTDLKVSIAIQKMNFYDNLEFIDCLNNLIDAVILTNKRHRFKYIRNKFFFGNQYQYKRK